MNVLPNLIATKIALLIIVRFLLTLPQKSPPPKTHENHSSFLKYNGLTAQLIPLLIHFGAASHQDQLHYQQDPVKLALKFNPASINL